MRRGLPCVVLLGVMATPAASAAQPAPGPAEIRGAVASLIESERHPLLRWPDITRYLGVLSAVATAEPDGLFWFAGDSAHPALAGAIEAIAQSHQMGFNPADYDA